MKIRTGKEDLGRISIPKAANTSKLRALGGTEQGATRLTEYSTAWIEPCLSKQRTCAFNSDNGITDVFFGRVVVAVQRRSNEYGRFEIFMAVTAKNAVFIDVPPCGSC
jgi:hypothetical protein